MILSPHLFDIVNKERILKSIGPNTALYPHRHPHCIGFSYTNQSPDSTYHLTD